MTEHTEIKIRSRAYALWLEHGCEEGRDMDFWLLAEREILGGVPMDAAPRVKPAAAEPRAETKPKAAAKPKTAAKPKAPAKPKAAAKPKAPAKPKTAPNNPVASRHPRPRSGGDAVRTDRDGPATHKGWIWDPPRRRPATMPDSPGSFTPPIAIPSDFWGRIVLTTARRWSAPSCRTPTAPR